MCKVKDCEIVVSAHWARSYENPETLADRLSILLATTGRPWEAIWDDDNRITFRPRQDPKNDLTKQQ